MTLVVVLIAILALGLLVLVLATRRRTRKPVSLEQNLERFRRGLDALDPANDPLRRKREQSGKG